MSDTKGSFRSFGTILGLIPIEIIVFWFIQDVTRKKHSIPCNYPVIGV